MTNSWRISTDFLSWMQQFEKRMMRVERRPAVTTAAQIMGPGAGPYAVLVNDWNAEEATFVGVFSSEPGAVHGPDEDAGLALPADDYYWMGETFADDFGYGFQRLTRYRIDPPGDPGDWTPYARRFYLVGDLYAYGAWEAV